MIHRAIGSLLLLGVLAWGGPMWRPARQAVGGFRQNCGTLEGRFTSARTGKRILLQVAVQGPGGSKKMKAILDSGATKTAFPDSFLREVGHEPISRAHRIEGVGSGAAVAYTYRIPFPKVAVGEKLLPMGTGTLDVEGIKDFDLALIGVDVLERGVSLSTNGSHWTLTLPCPPEQSSN